MTFSRRHLLQSLATLPAMGVLNYPFKAFAATELHISHQFPGGTLT